MDRLAPFQVNDKCRLFSLAKKLQEKDYFKEVLSSFQSRVLAHILGLDNQELWASFLDGNCTLKIDPQDETSEENDDEGLEEGSKPLASLALNLRFVLWEKAIDFYFAFDSKSTKPQFSDMEHLSLDYDLIDSLDSQPEEPVEETVEKQIRSEEDDYDDDDDEDEKTSKNTEKPTGNGSLERSDGHVVIRMPISAFRQKNSPEQSSEKPDELPAPSSLEERDIQIKNFNKIYHNFEYDRETLIKRRKLEKSDLQIENQKPVEGEDSDIPITFGAASHSLKHLLETIREKRDDIALNDIELRSLFMDIRKNRGKWANDERVGQEELYEACEKVLHDLRGYTEHSTPFLNKVSKREAPNYGLIIKNPMDLNTVMKKLKSLAYQSKQEFVEDLMLIWNNCLVYNTDPKHFLRAHAIAMQKKTQKLAPMIPEITIRNRLEMEKDDEIDHEGSQTPSAKGAGKGGKSSKKGQMRREVVKEETETQVEVPKEEEKLPTPAAPTEAHVTTEDVAEDEEDEAEEGDAETREEDNDDHQDAELQAWKVLTAKSRANYCSARASLFDDDHRLRMNAEAIIRESKKMSDFNHFLDNKEVVSKGNKLLDNDEPYLLEYDIAGGIPELAYKGIDDSSQDKYENAMVDVILKEGGGEKTGLVLDPKKGLNGLYTKNITEIQEIRKICFKISLIRQMQTQQFMHRTQMRQPEIEFLKEVDVDDVSKLPNHELNDSGVQYAALRKSVAKISMHTGFESTDSVAINTLTQVAEKYLSNLAKTMKLHLESTSRNTLGKKEIVLLSLLENGVEKPDDLYTFIQERIKKTEAKLEDLRAKLSGFLKDLLRPTLENFNEQNFDDNSEQFTTGDFTNELGDDFFGFKELGLDKEFKMLSSSVPVYLLHSRLNNSFNSTGSTSKTTKYEDLKDLETVKLTAADVPAQIGLLHGFYTELVSKSEAAYLKQQKRKGESLELPAPDQLRLLEDEELPQKQRNIRPRLPPTGKIASVKKKPLNATFILSEEEEGDDVKEQEENDDDEDSIFGIDISMDE